MAEIDLLEIIPGNPRDRMEYRGTYQSFGPLTRDTGMSQIEVVDCLDGAFIDKHGRKWCLQPTVDFIVEMNKNPIKAILLFLGALETKALFASEIAEFIGMSRQAVHQDVMRAIAKLKKRGKFPRLAEEIVEIRRRAGII
jgi:hypothetical protein